MREIYVRTGDIMEIAVVEDSRLVEYVPDDGASSADVICLGRVERIMPGMKAAFVNIGQEKCGFLPLEERNSRADKVIGSDRPIEKTRAELNQLYQQLLKRIG